jgi:HAD superfamily hydrolase (TIGR01509 family)
MIKGILFDIDGTLLNSNDAHANAWRNALNHFGYQITFDEIRVLIGMGGDRLLPAVVPGLDVKHGKGKEINEYRKSYFLSQEAPDLQPNDGARELIQACLSEGLRLVIATSASGDEVETLLTAARVRDLIHDYTTASDVVQSKPAKDIVTAALEKIGLPKDEVIMVGDTPYDIAAAKKTGIQTVAFRSGGFSDSQLEGALEVFDSPHDMHQHLQTILHGSHSHLHLRWEKIAEEKMGRQMVKTYKLPDGTIKQFQIRDEGVSTGIFALTDEDKVIMIKQFRPGPEKVLMELPGGFVDEDESPIDAAKRELLEETGYSGNIIPLGKHFTSAYSTEQLHAFLATDCRKVQDPQLDPTEFSEVELIDIDRLKKQIEIGDITNAEVAYKALRFLRK